MIFPIDLKYHKEKQQEVTKKVTKCCSTESDACQSAARPFKARSAASCIMCFGWHQFYCMVIEAECECTPKILFNTQFDICSVVHEGHHMITVYKIVCCEGILSAFLKFLLTLFTVLLTFPITIATCTWSHVHCDVVSKLLLLLYWSAVSC